MKTALDNFETLYLRLTIFLAALVAVSIGLIAILIPLNLFIIKAGIGSIWWLNESIEFALFFGVFAGAPWVLQQGAHVKVDIVTSSLSPDASKRLDGFINLFGFALCLLLCVYGSRAGIGEFIDMTLPDKDVRIPNWIVVAFFAVSMALLAIEFLLRFREQRVLKPAGDALGSESGL